MKQPVMDTIDSPTLFVLNVLMALILAVNFWGTSVLIIFGLVGTALMLSLLVLSFADGAFGVFS